MKSFLIAILIGLSIGFIFLYTKNLKQQDEFKRLGNINNHTLYKYEPEFCATALEVIYEDNENVYYFTCIKSENYVLKNKHNQTIHLKDALKNKVITIDELIKLEPNIKVQSKEEWYNSHVPASEYVMIYSKL